MSRYIFYGASGHAKVILDAFQLGHNKEILFVDDNEKIDDLSGNKVFLPNEINIRPEDKLLVSIGNNKIRKSVVDKFSTAYFNVVHRNSIVATSVKMGKGTFIAAGVVINPDTVIGNHVIVNTSASIDHDCEIFDFVHLAPNVTLCGGIKVGEGTLIGAGATIIPNMKIGKWAIIGAGTVVTHDVPDFAVVMGNPGRIIRLNE